MLDSLKILEKDASISNALSKLRLYMSRLRKDPHIWQKLLRTPALYPALTYCADLADCSDERVLIDYTKQNILDYSAFARAMWQACHIIELC